MLSMIIMQRRLTVLLFFGLFYAEALVWFDAGCSCTYHLNEESGTQQVCAEILFINGTELTTSEYSVTLSLDTLSATADSKPLYIIIIVTLKAAGRNTH